MYFFFNLYSRKIYDPLVYLSRRCEIDPRSSIHPVRDKETTRDAAKARDRGIYGSFYPRLPRSSFYSHTYLNMYSFSFSIRDEIYRSSWTSCRFLTAHRFFYSSFFLLFAFENSKKEPPVKILPPPFYSSLFHTFYFLVKDSPFYFVFPRWKRE